MLERFTKPARQVVAAARDEAGLLEHDYIGSEHVLLGLVREEDGVAGGVLKDMGLTLDRARDEVVRIAQPGDEVEKGQLPFTRPAMKVLELSLREVLAFRDPYVATPHVLLGLTRANDDVADRLLLDLGAPPERVAGEVLRLRSAPNGSWEESAWDEPVATDAPFRSGGEQRMRATSVRAAVEVALVAANTKAQEEGRMVDLGDLLLGLAEGWPDDLVARAFMEAGVTGDCLREVVETARHRGE
jgi:ATP-dependent Clp protease ATP-binding subunit ClpC